MSDTSSYRPQDDPVVLAAIEEVRDWFRCWWTAWESVEQSGGVEGMGGAEYARLTAQARFERVPPTQVTMRRWIRGAVLCESLVGITEESLAQRQSRAKEKTQENDHAK